jgi:hypothetical protein
MTLKCPVKGGPTLEGLWSASTYDFISHSILNALMLETYLVVYKTPLLEESVDSHNSTHVSR